MAEPVVPPLSMEASFQFALLRTEVMKTKDLQQLQQKALQLLDMMEVQRRTANAMLREGFLQRGPQLPPLRKPADARE